MYYIFFFCLLGRILIYAVRFVCNVCVCIRCTAICMCFFHCERKIMTAAVDVRLCVYVCDDDEKRWRFVVCVCAMRA